MTENADGNLENGGVLRHAMAKRGVNAAWETKELFLLTRGQKDDNILAIGNHMSKDESAWRKTKRRRPLWWSR